jgi:hypothetical protein
MTPERLNWFGGTANTKADDMADPNEEFRQIFEEIKRTVNRIADREDSQDFELSAATGTSYLVRNRNAELRYIRDIRNAIGHPQHSSKTPAFVVTEGFLASCRGVLHGISKAARASDLGIKKTDLYFANWPAGVATRRGSPLRAGLPGRSASGSIRGLVQR